ncbi:hypothetical protein GCM10018952_31840 [Streptosporangium vulgare]
MAVIGLSEHQVPSSNAVTPVEEDPLTHSQDLQRERCWCVRRVAPGRGSSSGLSWYGAATMFLAEFRHVTFSKKSSTRTYGDI